MLEARLDNIPNYLTARSPQGLRRAMLVNNLRKQTQLVYSNIQFVDGKWYAWFYEETNFNEVVSDAVNDRAGET